MNNSETPMMNEGAHQMSWAELKDFINSISLQVKETTQQMKETDRRMQETDRRFEESRKEFDRRLEESRKEFDKRRQETDRRLEESRKRSEKHDQEIKLLFDRMEKTDRNLKKLNNDFVSQTGHIMEGLTQRSAFRALREAGFGVEQCCRDLSGSSAQLGIDMEIDLFYVDTTEAIAVEVKTHCTRAKINRFLKHMQNFKVLFPGFADLKVYVGVAALDFTEAAAEYAREKGIILIHVNDDAFVIDKIDKEKLKKF